MRMERPDRGTNERGSRAGRATVLLARVLLMVAVVGYGSRSANAAPPASPSGPSPAAAASPSAAAPLAWTPGAMVPAGRLQERLAPFSVLLYHARSTADAEAALKRIVGTRFPSVTLVREEGAKGPGPAGPIGFGIALPIAKQPLPPEDVLAYTARRLKPDELAALKHATAVEVASFAIDTTRRSDLASLCALAYELANDLHAVLQDADSSEFFTPEQWKSARLDSWQGSIPGVAGHLGIHTVAQGGSSTVDTVGMVRFGLPDLTLAGVSRRDAPAAVALVIYVAQQLLERPLIDTPGELTVHATSLLYAHLRPETKSGAHGFSTIDLRMAPPPSARSKERVLALVPSTSDGTTAALVARAM